MQESLLEVKLRMCQGLTPWKKIRINKYTWHIQVTLMILVNGDVMELNVLFSNHLCLPLLGHLYDNM